MPKNYHKIPCKISKENSDCLSYEKEDSPTETWSEETCRYTQESLRNLDFGWHPISKHVMMKKIDGSFGHIAMSDALKHIYRIVKEDGKIEEFNTVEELTKAGWALD